MKTRKTYFSSNAFIKDVHLHNVNSSTEFSALIETVRVALNSRKTRDLGIIFSWYDLLYYLFSQYSINPKCFDFLKKDMDIDLNKGPESEVIRKRNQWVNSITSNPSVWFNYSRELKPLFELFRFPDHLQHEKRGFFSLLVREKRKKEELTNFATIKSLFWIFVRKTRVIDENLLTRTELSVMPPSKTA